MPSEARYYEMRGVCLSKQCMWGSAISDLRDAIGLDPQNKDYQNALMQTLFDANKLDEAVEGKYGSNM